MIEDYINDIFHSSDSKPIYSEEEEEEEKEDTVVMLADGTILVGM